MNECAPCQDRCCFCEGGELANRRESEEDDPTVLLLLSSLFASCHHRGQSIAAPHAGLWSTEFLRLSVLSSCKVLWAFSTSASTSWREVSGRGLHPVGFRVGQGSPFNCNMPLSSSPYPASLKMAAVDLLQCTRPGFPEKFISIAALSPSLQASPLRSTTVLRTMLRVLMLPSPCMPVGTRKRTGYISKSSVSVSRRGKTVRLFLMSYSTSPKP